MKRLLIAFLFLLPFQAHAVLMRAEAMGVADTVKDSGNVLGYGFLGYEPGLPNPLYKAAVTMAWVFDTEESGPNISENPFYAQFRRDSFWLKSTTRIDPVGASEPVIEFGPLGPNDSPINVSEYGHGLIVVDERQYNPDRPPTDGYRVSSANSSARIPNWGFEKFIAGAYIEEVNNDLIKSFDLAQEFVWGPSDGGRGFGALYWEDPRRGAVEIYYTLSSFSVSQVPEPGTLGMMGAGLFALGFMRRKRTA